MHPNDSRLDEVWPLLGQHVTAEKYLAAIGFCLGNGIHHLFNRGIDNQRAY
jgi:hypothetical protein